MTKVTFVEADGSARTVDATDGSSLMEAAVDNLVPGIDGDCGGACACATCHAYVDPDWLDKLPPMGAGEETMLQFCEGLDNTSRLACQIKVCPELDGIVMRTPASQH